MVTTDCTEGELKFVRSKKHPGAIFIKKRNSSDNFICKVYAKKTLQETEANAQRIYRAWKQQI